VIKILIEETKFKQKEVYKEDREKPDIIPIRLNKDERIILNECKKTLEQPKDGTCIKTLFYVGANVLHDKKTGFILRSIFKNKRNNKRNGIVDFE